MADRPAKPEAPTQDADKDLLREALKDVAPLRHSGKDPRNHPEYEIWGSRFTCPGNDVSESKVGCRPIKRKFALAQSIPQPLRLDNS